MRVARDRALRARLDVAARWPCGRIADARVRVREQVGLRPTDGAVALRGRGRDGRRPEWGALKARRRGARTRRSLRRGAYAPSLTADAGPAPDGT